MLKFDIRKPDPNQQLWNRQEEEERGEHHIQKCKIETAKRNRKTEQRNGAERRKKKKQSARS